MLVTPSETSFTDYYQILGVAAEATTDEIKHAYRQMARRHHPDVDPSADAAERFLLIQTAFSVLSDSGKRAAYDEERQRRQQQEEARRGPLALQWLLSRNVLACGAEPQVVYALLDVTATSSQAGAGAPLNLCLLLDCSSSMRGESLRRIKEAAWFIVDRLTEHDCFSLVSFHDRAQVLIPNEGSVHPSIIRTAISALEARGGTEIAQGLAAALQEVRRRLSPRYLNHILFFTDGHTYGDEALCRDLARQAGAAGVGISALGLGPDWNEALLDDLAALSGGASAYIDTAEGITPVFQEQILRLRAVTVREASLETELGEGVTLRAAYKFHPALAPLPVEPGKSPTLALGGIEHRPGQTVLLEFQVPPLPRPGPVLLARMRLVGRSAAAPTGERTALVQAELAAESAVNPPSSPIAPRLRGFVERVVAYQLQERAWHDLAEDQIEQATSRLRSAATKLLELGEVDLARETIREAKRLETTGQTSLVGKKRIRYGTRGLVSSPLPWRSPKGRGKKP